MKEWIKSLLEDNQGGQSASTIRFLAFVWTLFLCGWVSFCVIVNAVKGNPVLLPPIDHSYVIMTSVLVVSKVGQRIFGEKPT